MGDCRDFSPYEGIPKLWPEPELPEFAGSEFDYTGREHWHDLEYVSVPRILDYLSSRGWHMVSVLTPEGRIVWGCRREVDRHLPYLRVISVLEAWIQEADNVPDLRKGPYA